MLIYTHKHIGLERKYLAYLVFLLVLWSYTLFAMTPAMFHTSANSKFIKAPISLGWTLCDSLRLTFAIESQSGLETVAVIRNLLACVAKSRKRFAKILNMFKNFMRQNSSLNSRKVIAGVSSPSRTYRGPFAI